MKRPVHSQRADLYILKLPPLKWQIGAPSMLQLARFPEHNQFSNSTLERCRQGGESRSCQKKTDKQSLAEAGRFFIYSGQ